VVIREIKSNGRDDQKYVLLIEQYKLHRRLDGVGALKYLDAALELARDGEVSRDALLGGAYI
jgi:hypothetical protein